MQCSLSNKTPLSVIAQDAYYAQWDDGIHMLTKGSLVFQQHNSLRAAAEVVWCHE